MEIYNAMQVKSGAKVEYNKMGTLNQPIQFLPKDKKDKDWANWNLDWLEWQGLRLVRRNARRFLKNYKLAKGIIDKSDYIVEEDNEYVLKELEDLNKIKDPILPFIFLVIV